MKALSVRIAAFALTVIILFGTVFMAVPLVALAATSETSYSQTNVLDDLKSSTVGGAPFDVKDYPYNPAKDAQIIHFVEYCYSYRENMQENYGLYIYVYNPKGQSFSENNKLNKIQMAVSYDADGNPTSYDKFALEFCNKSTGELKKNRVLQRMYRIA